MSEYSFGYDDSGEQPDLGEAGAGQQGPKWFRDGLDKLSNQVQELKAENDRLKAAQVKDQLKDALKAKGYDPAAAGLFAGTPDKLDDWLTAHGGALAKLPAEGQEQGEQAPAGPPASTVPADGQEQMQRMAEAGTQGVSAPQGSEAELVQRLRNASTEAEFNEIMRGAGNTAF
ncbi:hypothetical protein [Streptomyces sp. t39]|uniref:hypothetical protein n=1 Tax=Streptomyces sp. t39 TaxID=1828156 RepID=UPI0011CE5C39|nr:hypothetical protein [Streptomyces sp. t39]TXS35068.1 hypothetical protein EAO77_37875 [Streptomyces sp. t39]